MWAITTEQQKGLNMHIKYITCSDPRNYNQVADMFDLWDIDPRVEVAVQMHPGKVSPGTERYNWIKDLFHGLYGFNENLAIHVNNDWCDDICNGKVPDELKYFFNYTNFYSEPIVKRVQLNMPQKTADRFNPHKLKSVIDYYNEYYKKDFIIQYNDRTKDAVDALDRTGAKFQLLFDASGGRGQLPRAWQSPVYPIFHKQGYAGGLKPENVSENLDKISKVAGIFPTWIDAEGGLKTDDKFDVKRARQYILNTLAWEQKHRQK